MLGTTFWPSWTRGWLVSSFLLLSAAPTAAVTDTAGNPIVSDTKELRWQLSARGNGAVSIDSDRSSALVGFVGENKLANGHLSAELENEFAAVTLSSLDGKPLTRSAKMLLTTAGRVENTGQTWNARRTNADVWGSAPTRIEVIKGYLLLRQVEGAVGVDVTALDGSAQAIHVAHGRLLETGWEIPVGDVPAVSYLIDVIR